MSQIRDFAVTFLHQRGGLVEQAAPDLYEVLLPDALARAWDIAPYQLVAFSEDAAQKAKTAFAVEDTLQLGYNHPLVDEMVEAARARPTPTRYAIDRVRLTKQGLADLAREAWLLPNARIVEVHRATITHVLGTYLSFNFKVALISDEKHERLASVLVDAQSGYALTVEEAATIVQAAQPQDKEFLFDHLPPAPMRWRTAQGATPSGPLARSALDVLLARAQQAVRNSLADTLATMEQRSRRFRELDEARLNEYYDETEADLNNRLRNASAERRESLIAKLESVAAERKLKLADAANRYTVRIDLTLLNVMVVTQPKLVLPVTLTNRQTTIQTYAVWDPLLHRIEPLGCDVCGQSGVRLQLCQNGHLAHATCLAPQCIDCKRVFCADCTDRVTACDVCHQPLCVHSRIACADCGRYTCQAHQGLCHAADGQPVDLTRPAAPPSEPEPTVVLPPKPVPPPPPKAKPSRAATKPPRNAPPVRAGAPLRDWPKGVPKPVRMDVIMKDDAVAAFIMASRERQVAMRTWALEPEAGIAVECNCEKGTACKAGNFIYRPFFGPALLGQIEKLIDEFRTEYQIPKNKVSISRVVFLTMEPLPMRKLELFGRWLDAEFLIRCQEGFDKQANS